MVPPFFADDPYAGAAQALAGTPYQRIEYRKETESTNADAAPLLGDERCAGLTIVAGYQRRGAGRKGRSWVAQPGSALLFTTILPTVVKAAHLWAVPFWAALCVRAALSARGADAELHWPNDLLLGARKLGGILCQSRVTGEDARVGCGIGINVRRLAGADRGIDPPPAFCDDVANVDPADLLVGILSSFAATIELLSEPRHVARLWEAAAKMPGRRYRILKDGASAPFEAQADGLDDCGGLMVVHPDGSRETIAMADARALR